MSWDDRIDEPDIVALERRLAAARERLHAYSDAVLPRARDRVERLERQDTAARLYREYERAVEALVSGRRLAAS